MQREKTRKVYIFVIMLTALIDFVLLLIPVDEIMTGYSVMNGIERITYLPKAEAAIATIITPIVMLLVWEHISKKIEKKSQKEPSLQSYRLRSILTNVAFFLWISLPGFMGILNIIQFLRNLF